VDDPVYVYIVGTAGSGKSRFTAAFQRFMKERGFEVAVVNLDPGAEGLPYDPDVDIRDWIRLHDVMEEYQLGPNGAQIMAADLIALRLGELQAVLDEFRGPLVLVDTPGQTELFVFRESGRITMELLAPGRSLIVFLLDPFLARKPSAFVSQLMLSATTQFRFGVPLVNVVSKADLLKEEETARLRAWSRDPEALEDALVNEKPDLYVQMNMDVHRVLEGMGTYTAAFFVSGATVEGMEEVYTAVQNVFRAGDDLESQAMPDRE
jgi:GTPase SAR1 family protein